MKKITVITGHYGSGKSTFAANYAIKCAEQGEQVTVAVSYTHQTLPTKLEV